MTFLRSLSFAISAAGLITLAACNTPPTSENSHTQTTPAAQQTPAAEQTPPTREGPPLKGEAKDVDYMIQLGLMKGHLMVAQELLAQGKPDQAEHHIGHPVEEIYSEVESQLQERNVKDFKSVLTEAHDLIRSNPNDPNVKTNLQASMKAVDEAIQALPAGQRQSPNFVLQVINGLLDTADSEYTAAVANGKIVEVIEYQDSRGFVVYANQLYQTIADPMAQEQPEAHKAIETNMTEVMKAWPSATAPTAPVMTPEQVSQQVQTIEQNAKKVAG